MENNCKHPEMELLERGEAVKNNPAFQTELLIALKKGDVDEFKRLLPHTDINHFYPHPDFGTILYIAAAKGLPQFAELSIAGGADVNVYNSIRKDTPLHAACKEGHPEMVKLLLEHDANISSTDKNGRQPLHTAVFVDKDKYKEEHLHCLKTILDFGASINTQDRSGSTPLHLALIKNNTDAAETLLSYGANPYIDSGTGESVSELIQKQLPKSYSTLLPPGLYKLTNEDNVENLLFRYMYNKNLKEFKQLLKVVANRGVNIGKIHDGAYTLLQYACENEDLEGFITVLLENQTVDPNGTCPAQEWKPILLAAFQGNHNALRILVNHSKTDITVTDCHKKETALHKVARMERGSKEEMNYLKCMEILIRAVKDVEDSLLPSCKKLNINAMDSSGNTALHYAARNLDRGSIEAEKIVSALLRGGSYVGIRNKMGEPAISRVKPSLLENYLDECLGTNDEPPCEEKYELIFNYSLLIPPCTVTNEYTEDAEHSEDLATVFKETEPLMYICNNKEYQNLLKHPIITSFLYLKWHRIRNIFIINLIFYVFFVAFITAYILGVYGTDPPDEYTEHSTSMDWTDACSAVSIFLLVGLALRELFQFIMSPLQYIKSLENVLEVAVIVITVIMLFTGLNHDIKQHLAAIVILLVWIELVLLIGRHPKLSTYITMFTAVSKNFLKFLLWYALFIIAFALSFFVLFRKGKKSDNDDQGEPEEENYFANAGGAMLKTAVMLTGEFDFSDLPLETFKITSHLVFLLFLFLIAVVLLNLLNGLAVSDTQEVKDKAEMVGYKSRVILVSHVESMLLGKQLQFLSKLRGCFRKNSDYHSKFPGINEARGGLCPSIMIFPEMKSIKVLVNTGGKIEPRCCSTNNTCKRSCTMDHRVIEEARAVIAKKTGRTKIDEINQRLQAIEECLKQLCTTSIRINQ